MPRKIYGKPGPASSALRAARPHSSEAMLAALQDRATYAAVFGICADIFDADFPMTDPVDNAPMDLELGVLHSRTCRHGHTGGISPETLEPGGGMTVFIDLRV